MDLDQSQQQFGGTCLFLAPRSFLPPLPSNTCCHQHLSSPSAGFDFNLAAMIVSHMQSSEHCTAFVIAHHYGSCLRNPWSFDLKVTSTLRLEKSYMKTSFSTTILKIAQPYHQCRGRQSMPLRHPPCERRLHHCQMNDRFT